MNDSSEKPTDAYQVVRVLGSGNFGEVCEAVHPILGSRVALKRPLPRLLATTEGGRAFVDFVQDSLRLAAHPHPNLAAVVSGSAAEPGYLATELLHGETLQARLQRLGGRLLAAEAVALARAIALGLSAGHQHLPLHGDLHPGNVFLGADVRAAGKSAVKLTDFGWGRIAFRCLRGGRSGTVTEEFLMGLPAYLAPEQYWGEGVDKKVDTYALGVLLFELLAGRRPYDGGGIEVMTLHLRKSPPSLTKLMPGLPAELSAVVHAMLAKAPEQRPDMVAILDALTHVLPQLAAQSHPSDAPPGPATQAAACATALKLGSYTVTGRLSSEGQVTVFAVADSAGEPALRLKVLSHEAAGDAPLTTRFLAAAQALQRVRHRALLRVSDHGFLPDGRPFLAHEHVEGRPLAARLLTPLTVAEAIHILSRLALGLSALHEQGMLYLGLSISTVFLRTELSSPFACEPLLLDAESVQLQDQPAPASWPLSSAAMADPAQIWPFLAPEQCVGERRLSDKADVYGLATLAYRLLSGRLPLQADSPEQYRDKLLGETSLPLTELAPPLVPPVAPRLAALIERGLAKAPASRPTAAQFADELLALGQSAAPPVAPPPATPHPDGAGERPPPRTDATTASPATPFVKGGTELLPRPPAALGPPTQLGRFRMLRTMRSTNAATLFEVRHLDTGQRAVAKVLISAPGDDPRRGERFVREAKALSVSSHDGAVRILEFNQLADGTPYLIMEYVDGCPLRQRLAQAGPLAPAQALRFARQIADTLAVLHDRGVVHRDLHPGCVMLVPDEMASGERARLIGFDLAKMKLGGTALPGTSLAVSEPAYAAPEVLVGADPADELADVYALGVLLYEMLTGRPPFAMEAMIRRAQPGEAPVPPPAQGAASGRVLSLIAAMLSPVRAERPTMREVAAALAGMLAPPRRSLVAVILLSFLAFLALTALAVFLYQRAPVHFLVRSQPSGAEVLSADHVTLGKTPYELVVSRHQGRVRLLLKKSGFRSEEIELDPTAPAEQRSEEFLLTPTQSLPPARR